MAQGGIRFQAGSMLYCKEHLHLSLMSSQAPFTLSCHGAAGEVTGSKHLLETAKGSRILLDCGLFQGKREEAMKKNCEWGFEPGSIDAVVVSHAHIDHTGLLPKLVKDGFSGKIYCTHGTKDLCDPMLYDSAHIQEEDERYVKEKGIESPICDCCPLYVSEDVDEALKHFEGKNYHESFQVTDDVSCEFYDAGHVLGSAVMVLTIEAEGGPVKLAFTGDLGRHGMPILRDPDPVKEADYLICETTYGGRAHERVAEIEDDLEFIINKTAKRGGIVIIPAFALERSQEMLLRLENLIHHNKIPSLPIYLDSPLAGKLTRVFEKHPEYYDEEMKQRAEERGRIFDIPGLEFTESVDQSKGLNNIDYPCIIMAGSGMCESGRVRHHLKNHLENHKTSVMIVGYQAVETLGRKLVEGEKVVKIFNRPYEVKADIHVFKSLSAHADMDALDAYVKDIKGLKKIFLVHGEQESREAFKERLAKITPETEVTLPEKGETYEA